MNARKHNDISADEIDIEDIAGFKGYNAYEESLFKDQYLGHNCTYEEAEIMLTPSNHGCDLSELYTDFAKFGE